MSILPLLSCSWWLETCNRLHRRSKLCLNFANISFFYHSQLSCYQLWFKAYFTNTTIQFDTISCPYLNNRTFKYWTQFLFKNILTTHLLMNYWFHYYLFFHETKCQMVLSLSGSSTCSLIIKYKSYRFYRYSKHWSWMVTTSIKTCKGWWNIRKELSSSWIIFCRVVLFEFHFKFWNTDSIGIPARRLL